jgi:hypothetical protein
MVQGFENFQKISKENVDATVKSLGAVSKSEQTIATETAEYSKKSFEQGSAALERLLGVKTFDKAVEVQTDYAKTAYESFVAQATRLGELYTGLAKELYKPFETAVAKAATK